MKFCKSVFELAEAGNRRYAPELADYAAHTYPAHYDLRATMTR